LGASGAGPGDGCGEAAQAGTSRAETSKHLRNGPAAEQRKHKKKNVERCASFCPADFRRPRNRSSKCAIHIPLLKSGWSWPWVIRRSVRVALNLDNRLSAVVETYCRLCIRARSAAAEFSRKIELSKGVSRKNAGIQKQLPGPLYPLSSLGGFRAPPFPPSAADKMEREKKSYQ